MMLTPELSMEIQAALGSDIAMLFDECPPYPCDEKIRGKIPRPHHSLGKTLQGLDYRGKIRKPPESPSITSESSKAPSMPISANVPPGSW